MAGRARVFAVLVGLLILSVGVQGAGGAPTELFFSEYVEGSSNNKALEVYNGTGGGGAVELAAADYSVPATDRVNIADIRLNGTPISPTATYRVTVNIFLADGGDGFTVLTSGTDRFGGEVDLDAFEAYFRANSPVAPGPRNRITRLN